MLRWGGDDDSFGFMFEYPRTVASGLYWVRTRLSVPMGVLLLHSLQYPVGGGRSVVLTPTVCIVFSGGSSHGLLLADTAGLVRLVLQEQ